MQFDKDAKPIPATTRRSWLDNWGGVIVVTFCLLFLVWLTYMVIDTIRYQPVLQTAAPSGIIVDERLLTALEAIAATPTPRGEECTPFMEVGTVCLWQDTPTPIPNCPPLVGSNLCVYTGVENFAPQPTATSGPAGTYPH